MTPGKPPLVVQTTSRREVVIGLAAGLLVLAGLVYLAATFVSGPSKLQANMLEGKIVEKHFTPEREQQITFGRKGLKQKQSDGEYLMKVRVGKEGRIYEVPVQRSVYLSKDVGDSLLFVKPPSEQEAGGAAKGGTGEKAP